MSVVKKEIGGSTVVRLQPRDTNLSSFVVGGYSRNSRVCSRGHRLGVVDRGPDRADDLSGVPSV